MSRERSTVMSRPHCANPILVLLLLALLHGKGFGFTNCIINHSKQITAKKTSGAIFSTTQNNEDHLPAIVIGDDDNTDTVTNYPLLLGRRQLFRSATAAAAAAVTAAAVTEPSFATAAKPQYEIILPQSTLLADLSNSPQRHIIITGANSGVGLAGAKLLTAAGHQVTLACRTQSKADAAAQQCNEYAAATANGSRGGGKAVAAECNLASMASIRAFAASVKETKIDTLVLNAGLAHGQNDKEVYRTADGFEETIGVNHLGHFLLANLLAPSLTDATSSNSNGGRLVVTASPVHDPKSGGGDVGEPAGLGTLEGLRTGNQQFEMVDGQSYNPDKAYKDSKLCNILFMEEAARRYKGKFTVNAFSPGLIADPNGFFRYQDKKFSSVFNKISQLAGVAETNEFGGAALSYLAVSSAMDDGQTGGWYDSAPPGKHQLARHEPSVEGQNVEEQHLLWDLSEALVGAK